MNGKRTYGDGTHYGNKTIKYVDAGAKFVLKTDGVLLCNYEKRGEVTIFGSTKEGAVGVIQGLWIKIVATLPSGERIVDELRLPIDIGNKREWSSTSVFFGLNTELTKRATEGQPPSLKLTCPRYDMRIE